jgi:anti-sigma regulatory factor (Ser/Thr protein kinase)
LLLACFRLTGVLIIFARFYINETLGVFSVKTAFLAVGLVYAISTLVLSTRAIEKYDHPAIYTLLIFIDTLMIGLYIFITKYLATDIYLLFFLPLIAASHFVERKKLLVIGNVIVFFYLFILYIMFQAEPTGDIFKDVFAPWFGKASFLMLGTLVFRAQRSLPSTNDRWIVSPAKTREKLEGLLGGIKNTIPYDTASVQLLYRDRLMIVACHGFPNPEDIYQIEFPADDSRYPNENVIKTRKPMIAPADKYKSFGDEHYFAKHIKSWMGVPLISSATDECFGMISFDSSTEGSYSRFDALQANLFAKRISSFLVEVALAPAALTLATNRENLLGSLKSWAALLPSKTSKWDDDVQAAQELVEIGQKIFRTEDCAIFFLRHHFDNGKQEPVLHLIASSAIPQQHFEKREMKVTGRHGDGLTGLAVHRNRTLNYGSARIKKSPYSARFTSHLRFMFSKSSRQVMISPLRDSRGNAVGAIKIENRMGVSSEREFFPVEKNLFEIYASTVSLILETIRQQNYIKRLDEDVHGLRTIIHSAAIDPLQTLQKRIEQLPACGDVNSNLSEIVHVLEYVKMVIHRVLSDSVENLHLEKEGLIHAIHHYLKSLQMIMIPQIKDVCDRIDIKAENIDEKEIPYHIQEIFFNIAREGILNIVRHSKIEQQSDGRGEIMLTNTDGVFILSIKDNGIGFLETEETSSQRRSFGIRDMKDQMRYKKHYSSLATVEVRSHPGQGTLILAKWAPRNVS